VDVGLRFEEIGETPDCDFVDLGLDIELCDELFENCGLALSDGFVFLHLVFLIYRELSIILFG
jgi:hypothetical protein